MKITGVRTVLAALGAKNCIFVLIETDEGITGLGETVLKRRSKMIEAGIHALGRYLIGKDPTHIEDHWEKMYRDSFWVGGPMATTPLSAVEIALWDILGQSLGVPIYKLMGGPTRDRVPVYCHCAAGATPEEFAANALACVQRGYRALKVTLPLFYGGQRTVKVAGQEGNGLEGMGQRPNFGYSGTWGEIDRSLKETELLPPDIFRRIAAFFAAAREAVGPDVHLMVDCHGRLSAANAIRLCEALAEYDLLFIEEPVPPENVEALREVSRRSSVPIAAGERWSTIYDARRYLGPQAVAIAQPDVVNCGGLMQAKKMAALAEAEYISFAPHNPNGPIATVANVHLAASIPNFLILETIGSEEDKALQAKVIDPPLRFEDGCLLLPTGSGLGARLNEEACKQFPYQSFEGWR
jgi:galactonate dehydratase